MRALLSITFLFVVLITLNTIQKDDTTEVAKAVTVEIFDTPAEEVLISEPIAFTKMEKPQRIMIPKGIFCQTPSIALNALETGDASLCYNGTGLVLDIVAFIDISTLCDERVVFKTIPQNSQITDPPRYLIMRRNICPAPMPQSPTL
jgi:hypothetical protein